MTLNVMHVEAESTRKENIRNEESVQMGGFKNSWVIIHSPKAIQFILCYHMLEIWGIK